MAQRTDKGGGGPDGDSLWQQDLAARADMESFYKNAEELLAESGGKLDSLSFGRKWRVSFPNDSLETYRRRAKGTVGEILAASDRFNVTVTKLKSSVKTFTLVRELGMDPSATKNSLNATRGALKPPSMSDIPDDALFEPGPATASEEGFWEVDLQEGGVEERQSTRGYKFSVVNVGSASPLNGAARAAPSKFASTRNNDEDDWDEFSEDKSSDSERSESAERATPRKENAPRGRAPLPVVARPEAEGRPASGRSASDASSSVSSSASARSASSRSSRSSMSPSDAAGSSSSGGVRSNSTSASASSAARLIDAWAQASGDDSGERGGEAAVDFINSAGAMADAAPYTRLIQDHSRAGAAGDKRALDRAFKVLEDMQAAGVAPTLRTYTALISACAKSAGAGHGVYAVERGMQALQNMQKAGVVPDIVAYNALLDACAKAASSGDPFGVERGLKLFMMLIDAGLHPTIVTFNTLMHTCAKCSSPENPAAMQQANELVETMKTMRVSPDIVTYNALIDTCARAGSGGLLSAISVLDGMRESDMKPDIVTFNSLVNACARAAGLGDSAAFSTAMQVLGKMQVTGVDANVVTFNSLMTIIAKSAAAGDIPDAGAALSQGTQVVGMMLTAEISPNIITFNALVTGIVKAGVLSGEGCREELADALSLMSQAEVQPNSVTSVLLMDWFVADGLSIAESGPASVGLLEEAGLEVDCGSFKIMVDTCIRSGTGVRHMIPILERMERAGCLPPIVIWNSLLNLLTGSPDEGGIDVGVEVFTIMRRADVQVNQATFSALAAIRKAMEKAGVVSDGSEWLQSPIIKDDQLWQPGDEVEEEEQEGKEKVEIGDENNTVDWIVIRPARPGSAFEEWGDEDEEQSEGTGEPEDDGVLRANSLPWEGRARGEGRLLKTGGPGPPGGFQGSQGSRGSWSPADAAWEKLPEKTQSSQSIDVGPGDSGDSGGGDRFDDDEFD